MMGKFILGLLLLCAALINNTNGLGQMIPNGTLNTMVGETIEITCMMNMSNPRNQGLNISNLTFSAPHYEIKDSEIEILNNTTKRLRIENAPAMEETVTCKSGRSGVDALKVHVGFKPAKVIDFKCRSYNWENFTCSFQRPENPVVPIYKLFVSVDRMPRPNEANNECDLFIDHNRKYHCTIDFRTKSGPYRNWQEYYHFLLVAHNELGELSEQFIINNFESVIPDPPQNLSAIGVTSDSAVLMWNIPSFLKTFPRKFEFMINYTSEVNPKQWKELRISSVNGADKDRSFELTKLEYANVLYVVRVSFKVRNAPNIPEMWSNYSELKFYAASRTPDNPPQTDIGAFSYDDNEDVFIFWKALPRHRHNGNNFRYKVTEMHHPSAKPDQVTHTMAKFEKLYANTVNEDLQFWIYAENNVGKSELASHVRVPSISDRLPLPMRIKKIWADNQLYNISWNAPIKSKQEIISYTIFWCESRNEQPNDCEGSIDFYRVNRDTFNFQISSNNTLNVAISANTHNSSSGMTWAMCTAQPGKSISKLTQIYMVNTQSTFVEFRWNLPCADGILLTGYMLYYCPIKDQNSSECTGTNHTLNIVSADIRGYNLTDLMPYTSYKMQIVMLSADSVGPLSDPLVFTTPQAKPTLPRNLKAKNITNSSVELTWGEPLQINGELEKYEISVNGKERIIENPGGSAMKFTLDGLDSFTEYEVVVIACTVACSGPSNSVKFKTAVGKPGEMVQPQLMDSDRYISWKPPSILGGPMQYYELNVTMIYDDNNKQEHIIKINGTTCTLNFKLCDVRMSQYRFSVRAVNVLHSAHADEATNRIYGNGKGHLVKRDLAQASNLHKRHSNAAIDTDIKLSSISNKLIDDSNNNNDENRPAEVVQFAYDPNRVVICKEELDSQFQRYLLSDKWPKPLHGEWSRQLDSHCRFDTKAGGFYFILVLLVIFTMAFVYCTFLAIKKINKMKDIGVIVYPDGLEDIKDETKAKHLEGGINIRDDAAHDLEFGLNSGEQEQSLLRSRMESASSNSSENNSHCEYNEGADHSTEYDQQDDSAQTMSESLDSVKCSPTPLIPVQINVPPVNEFESDVIVSAEPSPSPSPPTQLTKVTSNGHHRHPVVISSSSNYVQAPSIMRANPMLTSNGYVTHDAIIGKPTPSGYTPWAALDANPASISTNTNDAKTKTPIVASTDAQGISGYVTHKQLSDFGQGRLMH